MIDLNSKEYRLKQLHHHMEELDLALCRYTDVYDLREVIDQIKSNMQHELNELELLDKEDQSQNVWVQQEAVV